LYGVSGNEDTIHVESIGMW